MNMTTNESLQNIYNAARMAPLNAEQHDLIRKYAEQIAESLKPKEEPKGD